MLLTIATANSRKATKWKNINVEWPAFAKKLLSRYDTQETAEQYQNMSKEQKGEIKDVGGFVGGYLSGGRRVKGAVLYRSVLTLDIDKATQSTANKIRNLFDKYNYVVYSTHSHTPKSPRLRLVMPLSVELNTGTKYEAFGRYIAGLIGIDEVDSTTYQMERLMYYPSTSKGAEFVSFGNVDKEDINPIEILANKYIDYRNIEEWDKGAEESKDFKPNNHEQPKTKMQRGADKDNTIGTFCRLYDIHKAIETFLPHVYKRNDNNHYTYLNGSGSKGLAVLDGGEVAYSHHSTDPACGKGLNAFDLVRVHLFGYMDNGVHPNTKLTNLPSMKAMYNLMEKDTTLKAHLITQKTLKDFGDLRGLELKEEKKDKKVKTWFDEAIEMLEVNKDGKIKQTAQNLDILINKDPNIKDSIYFDEFADKRIISKDLPWREVETPTLWTDEDEAELRGYIETRYGITHQSKISDAITRAFSGRRYNPTLEHILRHTWDKTPRVDTLFVDYLGAEDTPLVRALTRKTLVACVARVLSPGIKYDQITVFVGKEGIGKSTFLKALGGRWYTDSLHTIEGKDAMEQIAGAWVIELAELQALKKSEITAVKAFVSKQSDRYRPAYGRNSIERPRRCVFFATTNEQSFLKNETGNRRFWTIEVGTNKQKKSPFELVGNTDELGQIFAEAIELYKAGETLYLDKEQSEELIKLQRRFEVIDDRTSMLEDFLNIPIPMDWYTWSVADRVEYYKGLTEANASIPGTHAYNVKIHSTLGYLPNGYTYRTAISIPEIKTEYLGIKRRDLGNTKESRDIALMFKDLTGWIKNETPKRVKGYGLQKVWENLGNRAKN